MKFFDKLFSRMETYDFENKELCISNLVNYMFARCQRMIKYTGLPDTFNPRVFNIRLFGSGYTGIFEHNGEIYNDVGGLGGIPNHDYLPSELIIANPYIPCNKTFKIDKDCVIVPNDSAFMGILPLCRRYATQIVENELSMKIVDICSRIPAIISASDDITKASAEKFIEDLFKGKISIVGDSEFMQGVNTFPYASTNTGAVMQSLIEYQQYLKASWFNELGLDANYNMKRESLNSAESQLNNDALKPLIDDMIDCRNEAFEKVNAMFGLNIHCELGSAWKDNEIELQMTQAEIPNVGKDEEGDTNEETKVE